ncbi:MAG: cytochrome C peroxidase [Polyangiaceae bacterium]|nr:cytochrome C peroxidase [Polyangiaceae bacterium]
MKSAVYTVLGLGGLAASLAGCGGAKPTGAAVTPSQAVASARCERRAPGVGAARADERRESSPVALARLGSRTIAYIADEDDGVVHTVDVAKGEELSVTQIGGAPSQVLVTKDGRVLVSLRDRSQVAVLEPADSPERPLAPLCAVDLPAEPVALAATPDDSTILVTSGWGRALSALDADHLTTRFRVTLAREPRAVVVSDDGSKAFVAHVVGSRMSAVDLKAPDHPVRTVDMTGEDAGLSRPRRRGVVAGLLRGEPRAPERMGCQSFALAKSVDPPGRIFAPQVLVDPGDTEQSTSGYGDGFRAAEVASIAVIDDGTGAPLDSSLKIAAHEGQVAQAQRECLLPRAIAVDPARRSMLVTCLGIDAVVEYDAASADPRQSERRRWQVASGPTGVAVDQVGRRAIVWSQFDQAVSVIALDEEAKRPTMLAVSRKAKAARDGDYALGRRLFHAAGDTRIAADGRACASCHPDGRDDSLTWSTPEGPRNTPMLAGRLTDMAPFGWNGASDTVGSHLHHTLQRLRGRGLEKHEIAALEAFVGGMRAPSTHAPAAGPAATRIARGKAVFESAETACASCHTGGAAVDGVAHDVQSKAKADTDLKFDTPSLRFVGGTAPYFHDGRYRTLRELLVGSDGKMGHVSHLPAEDVDALEAYLRTL